MTPASIAEARARVQQHAQDVLADLSRGDDEAVLTDACALLMDAYDLRHSAEARRDALRTLAELAVQESNG